MEHATREPNTGPAGKRHTVRRQEIEVRPDVVAIRAGLLEIPSEAIVPVHTARGPRRPALRAQVAAKGQVLHHRWHVGREHLEDVRPILTERSFAEAIVYELTGTVLDCR